MAILVPVFLLIATLAWKWVESEQLRIRKSMQGMAIDASDQIDRYIGGQIAMLQALATSPAIDQGDFEFMDSQMRELARAHHTHLVLRAHDGRPLVDTRHPQGQQLELLPLMRGELDILKSKQAYVSDLFATTVASTTPLTRVTVPVIRDGQVRYVIGARLPAATLTTILRDAGIRDDRSGAVTDRAGRIVASADGRPDLIGTAWLAHVDPTSLAGEWTGPGPDAVELRTSYRRSALSGWMVAVTVPSSYVDDPLYRSVWLMAFFSLGLALLVGALSGLIAHRIIRAQRMVRAAAISVGLGETVSAPRTNIRETDLIGDALAEASVRLRDQAAALQAANQDLEERVAARTLQISDQAELIRATMDNMAQGLLMVGADGFIAICNQRAIDLLDLPPDLIAAKPAYAALVRHQLDRGDFPPSDENVVRWAEDGGLLPLIANYERTRPNGTVLEIRTVRLAGGGAVRTYTDITARKEAERQAVYLARHDPLTSLPNRTLLLARLKDELADPSRTFALILIDLDRFKAVNDRHGHPTGDALLRLVAERLRSISGPGDFLVRLGGDEFAVIQIGQRQPDDACDLAARIVRTLAEPFQANGHVVRIGTSVGIAIAPQDGSKVDQILQCADLALYRAKFEGRNAYRTYEPTMKTAALEREALELDLRLAMQRGELELHFQPVIGLVNRETSGFEALCRWKHPIRGLVGPDVFIPVAEDARLIVELGTWILQEACHAAAAWPAHTRVLINVSGIQIEDTAFVSSVLAAIAQADISPGRVQLEITESVLVRESEAALHALKTLRDFGLTIALDDFGTGYSSLSYLRQFPLDNIKIDRSFVACFEDPRSARIMSAIASLAVDFGMAVTAEGVETPEQLDFVASIGCTDAQGYLFGKPMPAADTRRWFGGSPVARVA